MPRAFTADETDHIRARLKQAGAETFARRGLRGTTVEGLAAAAGISKGAFYRFFDTKEALLIALLDDYETATHARVEAAVRADPGRGIDLLIDTAVNVFDGNPLLSVLMSEEGMRVISNCPPEQREALLDRDERLVRRVLAVLAEAGITPGITEKALLGLLRSLVFVSPHRQAIGPDLIDEVSTWLKHTLRTSLRPSR